LIVSTVVAGQDKALDNYLEIAAGNNPKLKASYNEYYAALEKVNQSGALPDPNLAFGYFASPVETRMGPQQFRISASQMFPWFGRLKAEENAQMLLAKAKYETFRNVRSELFHDLRSLYFDLYYNVKAMEIMSDNIEILQTLKELTVLNIETGKASAVDEYRLNMEINEIENELALLFDKHKVLETSFHSLLNSGEEQLAIILPDSLQVQEMRLSRQEINDSIMKNNPLLAENSLQQDALAFKKEVTILQNNPEFLHSFLKQRFAHPTNSII